MSPTAETFKQARWSQEEIDILVQMTHDQLELETQDSSRLISWTLHWKKVSSRLKEHGYSRSPTACRSIWKRGVEQQRVVRDQAGPDWNDTEHEILVHMTKKQLDLETADPSTEITWAKHWGKVSLQLEEEGYSRTPDNCDAYWQLVQTGEESASESEEDQSPEAQEDAPPLDFTVTSPQVSKPSLWSLEEYENILGLLKARREMEETKDLEKLDGKKLWLEIAQSHRESGYDRTFDGCRSFWNKQGRERSGYDERTKALMDSTAQSSAAKSNSAESKPSSLSLWSPVNGAEESTEISRNPAIEALRKFQKERSSETSDPVSSDSNSAIPKSMNPVLGIESDHEQMESSPGQAEKKRRKKGVTNFRLTPEQRAVFEAEVAKNDIISSERKQELAQELDLEYKTVRNWFTNYNVKARRSQGAVPIIPTEKSAHIDFDDSLHDGERRSTSQQINPVVATPTYTYDNAAGTTTGSKRPYSLDHDGFVHESPPHKRAVWADAERHPNSREQPDIPESAPSKLNSGFNPVNSASSRRSPVQPSHATTQLPQPPIVPCSAAPRVNASELPTHPQNGPVIETSPSTPHPAQLDSLRPIPSPQTITYPARMMYNDPDGSGSKEAPSHPSENGFARERIAIVESRTMKPHEFRHERNDSINPPGVNGDQRPQPSTHAEAFDGRRQLPGLVSEVPQPEIASQTKQNAFPIVSATNRLNAPHSPRQAVAASQITTLPSQQPAMQDIAKKHCESSSAHPKPAPTPLHRSGSISANERRDSIPPPKPAINPAPTSVMPSVSASLPANEDPKATAYRTVQKFNSEIETLRQANGIRNKRIANIEQQLSNFVNKRTDIDRAKQAEITRALQEIEKRYEEESTALNQQEKWLRNSRDTELEGLNRSTTELLKMERSLVRWQDLVDFYDNEEDEKVST